MDNNERLLIIAVFIPFATLSCTKIAEYAPFEDGTLLATVPRSVIPSAMPNSITMDLSGDAVMPDNNIRVNGFYNLTVEGGSGYLYYNSSTNNSVRPLLKVTYGRTGRGNGLRFNLPARDSIVNYDQPNSDRLESHLVRGGNLARHSDTAFYSGFSVYIPSTSETIEPNILNQWFTFHQWHQSAPEGPPIALMLMPGYSSRLGLCIRYGVNKAGGEHPTYVFRQDDTTTQYIDLPTNKWIDFIVRWKFGINGGGEVDVYRHDIDAPSSTHLYTYRGPIGYTNVNNENGINEKFGIYRKASYTRSHVILYDQLRVGRTYNEVRPWQ
ncbi:heparin lyase I family protein [Niabella aurantiaca]|uniref:heparin lyase I family protein n=1 Tax=Niabella aurantiaca TaxID=379900 RepID=UPI000363D813|nr:heparin lyase I family protein [Niabella aurantiaca]